MASSNLHIVYNPAGVSMYLPSACIKECTAMGAVDSAVEQWTGIFRSQLDTIPQDVIRRALKPTGAWEDDELADHEQNLRRLVWLAAGNARDNYTRTGYVGI